MRHCRLTLTAGWALLLLPLTLLLLSPPARADVTLADEWWWWALASQRNSTREERLTNQLILGAHNAFNCTIGDGECTPIVFPYEGESYVDGTFCAPSQKRRISRLLEAGVRFLELDIQWPVTTAEHDYMAILLVNGAEVCRDWAPEVRHGSKSVICSGGVIMPVFIQEIRNWIDANPSEVVYLEFDNNYIDMSNWDHPNIDEINTQARQDCRRGILKALLSTEALRVISPDGFFDKTYTLLGTHWMEDRDWVHPSVFDRPETERRPPAPSPAELLRLGVQVFVNLESWDDKPGRYEQPDCTGCRDPDAWGMPPLEDDLNFRVVQGDRLSEGATPVHTSDVDRYASMSGVIVKMDRILDETYHLWCPAADCAQGESESDGDRMAAAVWSWKENDKAPRRRHPHHAVQPFNDFDDVAVQDTRWASTSPDAGATNRSFALRRVKRTPDRVKWWTGQDFVPLDSQGIYEWKISSFQSNLWHDFLRIPHSELDDDLDGLPEWRFAGPLNGLQRQQLADAHLASGQPEPVWINVQDLDRDGHWEVNAETFHPLPVPEGETDVDSLRVFDESGRASFAIVGGADAGVFELLDGHFLAFKVAPPPIDANGDNVYEVEALMTEPIGTSPVTFTKRIFALVQPVPEPRVWTGLAVGILALAALRRGAHG